MKFLILKAVLFLFHIELDLLFAVSSFLRIRLKLLDTGTPELKIKK